MPHCPKHAELGKSERRFKTSLRLTAAEHTYHISSSHFGDQGTPEGHRGVHPTPLQSGGDQGTPEGHRRDTGGTPEGHRRDTGGTPEGHRGGTPGRTSDPFAVPPAERRRPRDTGGTLGAYIRPLCSAPSPTPATQKPPAEGGDQGTPEGHACHAKATGRAAETKGHRRDTGGHRRDTGGTPEAHRGVHPTPLQRTKSHACHAKATGRAAETKGHRRGTRGTPGRTSDPLAVHQVPRLPRKSHWQSGGDQRTPEGHRGAHPTPNDVCERMMCVCVCE